MAFLNVMYPGSYASISQLAYDKDKKFLHILLDLYRDKSKLYKDQQLAFSFQAQKSLVIEGFVDHLPESAEQGKSYFLKYNPEWASNMAYTWVGHWVETQGDFIYILATTGDRYRFDFISGSLVKLDLISGFTEDMWDKHFSLTTVPARNLVMSCYLFLKAYHPAFKDAVDA